MGMEKTVKKRRHFVHARQGLNITKLQRPNISCIFSLKLISVSAYRQMYTHDNIIETVVMLIFQYFLKL